MRKTALVALAAVLAAPALAQEPAKPGPEHELLKKLEGTWDTTMKAGGKEHKGTMTYKMELGGLWRVGSMDSDLGGQRFYARYGFAKIADTTFQVGNQIDAEFLFEKDLTGDAA